ncbi:PREDICTED: protein WWC3-like [Leptosomus discolor]|uniref:protein WWC3-like n=1 Tax=Leptosomus discolor TaxID=188344 RepID=UPI0005224623|nr:PREDICTED: protein WWC3-like [Leptosomus discolor]
MAAFAATSPCLAGLCRHEARLCGSSWCVAVPELWRKVLASAAGQCVWDVPALMAQLGGNRPSLCLTEKLLQAWRTLLPVPELWWWRVSVKRLQDCRVSESQKIGYLMTKERRYFWKGITKPLTFADCVGDELPLGWETVYDQQIGVYYMDHINQLTQIEDPREQWRREQERMLKEYLIVAQEALNAKKEIYQIKQQRFELAQEEYQQLHKMCEDDSRSYASSFSGFSTNTKYDPYQIKAEIASRRDRLSRLKRELAQMKQELQYKEKGVETLQEIDRKMSSAHTNYRLDEAQAIMSELRTIKKAICTGEKERQDLMQSLAKLTDGFRNSCCITDSLQDLQHNSSSLSDSCLPQQHCDACSQTDITGEFGFDDKTRLVDKVRLNWQYEEAKKRVSNIQQQLALLDNESWPGMAEADRDRLQLIKEKEALLQELQLISQQRRSPEDIARLEEEKRRLEDEIQRARATSAHGATERILLQEKRNCLLMQLEEATRLTSYLHSQLKR